MDIQELSTKSYDRALAQKNLQEKQLSRLVITYENGMWVCDTSLICTLEAYKDFNSTIVLLDSNNIPRKVNPIEFLAFAKKRHQEILNDWLIEYNNLSKIRTIKHVLE